jgi:hypothetical protein
MAEERGLWSGRELDRFLASGLCPRCPASRGSAQPLRICISADRDWHQRKERKTLEKQRKALEWLRKE